jgi:signal peptidase I
MTDEIQVQKKSKAAQPPLTPREEWSEFAKTAVIAVVLALLVRTFLYEPFNIPSGSMKPTLEVGDYLFVYKPAYGYSRYSFPFGLAPIVEGRWMGKDLQRGDVVVFKLPSNTGIDYIKRVVGLPGDTIEVIEGRLYINHRLVHREPLGLKRVEENGMTTTMMEYLETLPDGVIHSIYEESDEGPLDNTSEFTVPDGHYFMMGDNRDNSQDSRVQNLVGFVPYENIVGRASFLFFSTNGYANLAEVWKWPWSIRYSRLFNSIEPVRPPTGDAEAAGPAVP